jgi:hypothetical protein
VSRPLIRAQARIRSVVDRGSPAHAAIDPPTVHRLNVFGMAGERSRPESIAGLIRRSFALVGPHASFTVTDRQSPGQSIRRTRADVFDARSLLALGQNSRMVAAQRKGTRIVGHVRCVATMYRLAGTGRAFGMTAVVQRIRTRSNIGGREYSQRQDLAKLDQEGNRCFLIKSRIASLPLVQAHRDCRFHHPVNATTPILILITTARQVPSARARILGL